MITNLSNNFLLPFGSCAEYKRFFTPGYWPPGQRCFFWSVGHLFQIQNSSTDFGKPLDTTLDGSSCWGFWEGGDAENPRFKFTDRGGAAGSDWSDFIITCSQRKTKLKDYIAETTDSIKKYARTSKCHIFIQTIEQNLKVYTFLRCTNMSSWWLKDFYLILKIYHMNVLLL